MRRLIVCADDFGLDEAVNAAVEKAHCEGVLTCASLMVGAPHAADAVARARRLPRLGVGLHLVLVDGRAVLPPVQLGKLVDAEGRFDDNMVRAGCRFFFSPAARRQLGDEIRAQFLAFRATGLALDHVNAHKHLHIHPTVASLILAIGREFGMRALRVPSEPVAVLRRAAGDEAAPLLPPLYAPWTGLLRWRLRRAGISVNDHLLGLRWTGAMTEPRMLRLLQALPPGVSELYCHPATVQTAALARTMPSYRPADELAALTSPMVRQFIERNGIALVSYASFAAAAS